MLDSLSVRFLIAMQTIALLFAGGTWWRVWRCVCTPTLQDAAFWTSVSVSQAVILLGLCALRGK